MRSCLLFVLTLAAVVSAQGPADMVIHNGKILTIDDEQPRAEAVAIAGERILFVGSNADVLAYIDAARTKIFDARGRLITPGFNDAHIHFVEGGRGMLDVDLRDADTLGEVQEKVRVRAAELPAGTLIRGRAGTTNASPIRHGQRRRRWTRSHQATQWHFPAWTGTRSGSTASCFGRRGSRKARVIHRAARSSAIRRRASLRGY